MEKSLLELVREERAKADKSSSLIALAEGENRNLTQIEWDSIKKNLEDLAPLDERIATLTDLQTRNAQASAAGPKVSVRSEPKTYSPHTPVSFFADAWNAERGDGAARERLNRNTKELMVDGHYQSRAANTTSYAGAIVPQYLVDMLALALRNGRPFANLAMSMPLPDQGMQFLIPRGTTGASTAIQATENSAVSSTDEVFTNVTVPVVTIAGQQQVSRQSLERGFPGLDAMIYKDLVGAYAQNLDSQMWVGTGSSGQMLGVQNTAGISAASAFGAVPTATSFTSKLAGQIAAVASAGAQISPKVIFCHPRRWGWLNSLVDTTGRPLVQPVANGAYNLLGINMAPGQYSGDGDQTQTQGAMVVGTLQGLPIVTDLNIPTTVGTAVEDLVFVVDTDQMILFEEGDGMPRELRFEQTLGNQLTTILAVYGYAAFTAGRYPGATGKIGGLDTASNGLVAPTF